jgi:hypothetical protein
LFGPDPSAVTPFDEESVDTAFMGFERKFIAGIATWGGLIWPKSVHLNGDEKGA